MSDEKEIIKEVAHTAAPQHSNAVLNLFSKIFNFDFEVFYLKNKKR